MNRQCYLKLLKKENRIKVCTYVNKGKKYPYANQKQFDKWKKKVI